MTERFSNLKYNPKKAKVPLDEAFPQLFRYHEFRKLKEWGNWQKITAYILFMYSKDTDLAQEFPSNLQERKEAAALEAGYNISPDGKWPSEISKIMDIKNQIVYDAIMMYLKIQNHNTWTEIVVTEEELFDFQKLRFRRIDVGGEKKKRPRQNSETQEQPEETAKKGKELDIYSAAGKKDILMDSCNKRIAQLEVLKKQFYGDSRKDLEFVEFKEMMTPENAERIMTERPYEEVTA